MYSTRRAAAAAKQILENRGSPFHIEASSAIPAMRSQADFMLSTMSIKLCYQPLPRSASRDRVAAWRHPPNPLKSPILIIVLLAVVGAVLVLAAIGYIWTHL